MMPVPENVESRVVQRGPGEAEISRTPFAALDQFITPTELHYVRDHLTHIPTLDSANWSLVVDGLVATPLALSLEALHGFPMVELAVTMECAGNGGANGAIGVGCISTARWRGPRLCDLLNAAGVAPEARLVVATGADSGHDPEEPAGPGRYARSLPIAKALDSATIVALSMNGAPLPPAHGFPARLIIPGWYGMDSIKWVASIRVQRESFEGFYVQHRYRERRGADGLDTGRPIRQMLVKSLIAHPTLGEVVAVGVPYLITGVAWAGETAIAAVSVSVDGGGSWLAAELTGPASRYAWLQWKHLWNPADLGPATIMVRAVDAAGRTQPLDPVPGQIYEANWVHRVRVEITR